MSKFSPLFCCGPCCNKKHNNDASNNLIPGDGETPNQTASIGTVDSDQDHEDAPTGGPSQ